MNCKLGLQCMKIGLAVDAENEWHPNQDTRNTVWYYGKNRFGTKPHACSDADYDGNKAILSVVNIITLTNVR